MANLNIFGKDWTDIVFEGRNKEYGAYKLRNDNPKNTMTALALGIAVMGVAFGSKYAFEGMFGDKTSKKHDTEVVEVFDIELPPPPEEEPPVEEIKEEPKEVIQADASRSVQEEVKYLQTEVKKDNEVKNEQKTAQKDFDDTKTSGREDREADRTAELKTDGSQTGGADPGSKGTGTGNVKSDVPVEDPNKIYVGGLTEKAAMPSGWQQKFVNQFRTPEVSASVNQITIRMQFVVEKDGSLTDIKVLNDQYGVAKEAERVLRSLPKWKPAESNGKKVRSRFTQPITIKIN
jgi:periplasmic protein TonB